MTLLISTAAWSWPQWCLIGLCAFSLFTAAIFHGQSRADYNVGFAVIDLAVFLFLLIAGGFFA